MRIISIRDESSYKEVAARYIYNNYNGNSDYKKFENSVYEAESSKDATPQWYLAEENHQIVGCAGLVKQDAVDRDDLTPWICCLYVEPKSRGIGLGEMLIDKILEDADNNKVDEVYVCSEQLGFFTKFGFTYHSSGFTPDREGVKIYSLKLGNSKVK